MSSMQRIDPGLPAPARAAAQKGIEDALYGIGEDPVVAENQGRQS